MAIHYTMTIDGEMLVVHVSGYDESLADVTNYGMAVIEAGLENGSKYILCDETDLEYRLGTVDIFQAAASLAEHAPRVVKTAIVCNPRFSVDAFFWETVAVNRGVNVRMFSDLDTALSWLKHN